MKMRSLTLSPHEVRALSEIAFDKALYAAWACSWRDYVAAGDFDPVEDTVESLELATQRAECAMADAKAALAAACPGLEIRI